MEVILKVRFKASKERFENYGPGKYMVYLSFEEDGDTESILKTILSRKLGLPESRIHFKSKNFMKDWVFKVD